MEKVIKLLKSRIQHAQRRVKDLERDHGADPNSTHNYHGGRELGYWRGILAGYENSLDTIEEVTNAEPKKRGRKPKNGL